MWLHQSASTTGCTACDAVHVRPPPAGAGCGAFVSWRVSSRSRGVVWSGGGLFGLAWPRTLFPELRRVIELRGSASSRGRPGQEEFQFVRDRDEAQVIHPAVEKARSTQSMSVCVCVPTLAFMGRSVLFVPSSAQYESLAASVVPVADGADMPCDKFRRTSRLGRIHI